MKCRLSFIRTACSKVRLTKAQMLCALHWGKSKIRAILLAIGMIVSINHEFDFVMTLATNNPTLTGLIVIAAILLVFGHEIPELMLDVAVIMEMIGLIALALGRALRWLDALWIKWFGGDPDDTGGASVVTP